jgi:hypothetical protein
MDAVYKLKAKGISNKTFSYFIPHIPKEKTGAFIEFAYNLTVKHE